MYVYVKWYFSWTPRPRFDILIIINLYLAKLASLSLWHMSIGGSVVECSPATRAARVRFPADAFCLHGFQTAEDYHGLTHSSVTHVTTRHTWHSELISLASQSPVTADIWRLTRDRSDGHVACRPPANQGPAYIQVRAIQVWRTRQGKQHKPYQWQIVNTNVSLCFAILRYWRGILPPDRQINNTFQWTRHRTGE